MSVLGKSHNNFILSQINDNKLHSLHEYVPPIIQKGVNILSFDENIVWSDLIGRNNIQISYDSSKNVIVDCSINPFDGTDIHFSEGRIGFGRIPLFNYKIDISVPENTKTTALHIGDGKFGFSFGNATSMGFLPQIVGIGSDENDAGLYLLGKTLKEDNSLTPVIILDGRRSDDTPLQQRPILGISSGSYTNFDVTVYCDGKVNIKNELEVEGDIIANDLIITTLDENLSLLEEINELRDRILYLENNILK